MTFLPHYGTYRADHAGCARVRQRRQAPRGGRASRTQGRRLEAHGVSRPGRDQPAIGSGRRLRPQHALFGKSPNVATLRPCRFLALTARSLHCRDSVRLQSYFHRPDEPVRTPARDPKQTRCRELRADHSSPIRTRRTVLISATMKSKKARMRGICRRSGWVSR